ncbi:hypothetical protein FB470_004924 [Amycolatopsis thermophila]|uniref:Uncharacterized protein n=1 Tax=Amycolatopsis thermophila TaxID=206084 RepID=A0ABU0F034_9PSEU|nr:hypothetical protein [Amycolatopsis thermophila]
MTGPCHQLIRRDGPRHITVPWPVANPLDE